MWLGMVKKKKRKNFCIAVVSAALQYTIQPAVRSQIRLAPTIGLVRHACDGRERRDLCKISWHAGQLEMRVNCIR